jgi:hypothetical protein
LRSACGPTATRSAGAFACPTKRGIG